MLFLFRLLFQVMQFIASMERAIENSFSPKTWAPLSIPSSMYYFWTKCIQLCPELVHHYYCSILLRADVEGEIEAKVAVTFFETYSRANPDIESDDVYHFLCMSAGYSSYGNANPLLRRTIERAWALYPHRILAWIEDLDIFMPEYVEADTFPWIAQLAIAHPSPRNSLERIANILLPEKSHFRDPMLEPLIDAFEWQVWSLAIDSKPMPWYHPLWTLERYHVPKETKLLDEDALFERSLFRHVYDIFPEHEQYGLAAMGIHPHDCDVSSDIWMLYYYTIDRPPEKVVPLSERASIGMSLNLSPSEWVHFMAGTFEADVEVDSYDHALFV